MPVVDMNLIALNPVLCKNKMHLPRSVFDDSDVLGTGSVEVPGMGSFESSMKIEVECGSCPIDELSSEL